MSEWINFVKQVQAETGSSYKDALVEASKRKKAGSGIWKLTPEQKAQYFAKKQGQGITPEDARKRAEMWERKKQSYI